MKITVKVQDHLSESNVNPYSSHIGLDGSVPARDMTNEEALKEREEKEAMKKKKDEKPEDKPEKDAQDEELEEAEGEEDEDEEL